MNTTTESEPKTNKKLIFPENDACIPDGIAKDVLRAEQAADWRLRKNGGPIPTLSYADQPYLVRADDGALVCVVTTGDGHEGARGQHVVVLRSLDEGRSWSDPIPVESPEQPESSYAVLFKTGYGRLYCFYNFNEDDFREMETDYPGNPPTLRVDTLGHYVFKYSDDHGKTWSQDYHEVPVRETAIDRQNVRGGEVRFFWNVGRPFTLDGAAYLSLHKVAGFGDGFIHRSEGWLIRCPNLATERDPNQLEWETLPDGEDGLRSPEGGGPIAEEQSYVVLDDGTIHCSYRGITGRISEALSRDGGRSWTPPRFKRYPDGRPLKNPRAAAFVWKCRNGRYLQWFHNHGGRFIGEHGLELPVKSPYEDRNPVWVCAGTEIDGPDGRDIEWSQPEILIYDDDPLIRMSYPDLIETEEGLFISETDKHEARLHRIDPDFLQKLFAAPGKRPVPAGDCLLDEHAPGKSLPAPELPKFFQRDYRRADHGRVDLRQGFSLMLALDAHHEPGHLLDALTACGRYGWRLEADAEGALVLTLADGQTCNRMVSEPGLLQSGSPHRLAVIVDGGPKVVSFVVDGRFADGGDAVQFGWCRFSPLLQEVNAVRNIGLAASIAHLAIADRALLSCEASDWTLENTGTA